MNRAIVAAFLGSVLVACSPAAGQDDPNALSPEQQMELRTFAAQLSDPARSAKTKREAAELLLHRSYPQAIQTLAGFLKDTANRPAQIAVADAIAAVGGNRTEFVDPLLAMLTGEEPSVRDVAARALAVYKNHGAGLALRNVARDPARPAAVRTAAIRGLGGILDKSAVDALVSLLDDRDATVRDAAADSLAVLTNIRAFGRDYRQWRLWWEKNKDKPSSEWLVDLADSLARSKAALEAENARLRDRLARATEDLYLATPPAQRDLLIQNLMKDAVADVRASALRIVARKLAAAEPLAQETRAGVLAMLADGDPQVRKAAAGVVASLGEPQTAQTLLARLDAENVPEVRAGLLTALGQIQDPGALPAILEGIASPHPAVVAAGARALARLAGGPPLQDSNRLAAEEALTKAQRAFSPDQPEVREAVLTAMAAVAPEKYVPAFRDALSDPAAIVRLAGVKGLERAAQPALAGELERMLDDADRGVRQAAVAALGALDGGKHLAVLLRRTDPAVEADATVRTQAWNAVMAALAGADGKTLSGIANELADRPDATAQRIRILQMLVDARRRDNSEPVAPALRELGKALLADHRPAEAAVHLEEAATALAAAKSASAPVAWSEWAQALVQADSPIAVKTIAAQTDPNLFLAAVERVRQRLAELVRTEDWPKATQWSGAVASLYPRLQEETAADFRRLAGLAKAGQTSADGRKVAALVERLVSTDEAARASAAGELQALGDRALPHLLSQLRQAVSSEPPKADLEKAILPIVRRLAPKLNGYDPASPAGERLARIDDWIRTLAGS